MKKHYRHENDCLNCGSTLEGKFCHNCGQENLQIKESFGHMMNHAISDYFHFDHQFFHTLKPLFFSPGKLTNEYMAGKRVQFLHPVKMYIFISLIYFLLVFKENKEDAKVEPKQITTEKTDSIKRAAINKLNNNKNLTPQQKEKAINKVKYTGHRVKKPAVLITPAQKPKDTVDKDDDDDDVSSVSDALYSTTDDTTYAQYLTTQSKLPAKERDGWLERYYNEKNFALHNPKINRNELIKEGLAHNFPKMMFLLLPLFALILKITFWRNKKFYVEHLIYTFHLHCFVFLFLSIIILLKMILPATGGLQDISQWLMFLAGVAVIWYIYLSLRAVYHRSRWRTISKMIGISLSYLFVFSICMVLLLLVTAATVV
jgi:Protein of unknown function (DUF3667)